jgi:hypothetical protein
MLRKRNWTQTTQRRTNDPRPDPLSRSEQRLGSRSDPYYHCREEEENLNLAEELKHARRELERLARRTEGIS